MRDFRDAKAMAQTLRTELAPTGATLSHSECLEIIARVFGVKDWNILSAAIDTAAASPASRTSLPGDLWSGPLLLSRDYVLFPKQVVPFFIARERSMKAMAEASRGGFEVLLVAQKDPREDDPPRDAIYDVGVVADILETTTLSNDGRMKLTLRGRQRARLVAIREENGRRTAEAQLIRNGSVDEAAASPQVKVALGAFKVFLQSDALQELSGDMRSRLAGRAETTTQPGALADLIAQSAPGSVYEKQHVLETMEELLRLKTAMALLRT